ncbi:hypothetical protein WH47_00746 [Habropoda laboriosa]|uniref:Spondin domain-containing protein n=2 Tax=Aculeata TaxID=7434 RepID=A0A0L7QYL6_9HYME|nr:hypothetical protein WH47_00746 [Habropoda laboriosa]
MLHGTWLQWSMLLLLLLGTRLLFVVAQCGSFTQDRQEKEDKQDKLALYKVTLRTYWSRARFPRHYPEWKPPAQFGKLIGESLNKFSTETDSPRELINDEMKIPRIRKNEGYVNPLHSTPVVFPNIFISFFFYLGQATLRVCEAIAYIVL